VPAKYVIHGKPVAPRFRTVGKLGIVDWREDCSSCHNCVKRACVYGFYRDEADTLRDQIGYLDYIYQCKGCLSCVQDCTKNILTRVVNPEYNRLGDSYYTPEIVLSTWFQAETGRIPVSGSGYGGPFSGQGFDSMWTDMSEIVRPTRDGIHGREYISTSVDIGRKLPYLTFRDGQLAVAPPPLLEVPLPVIFDVVPKHWQRGPVLESIVAAAAELGTMAVVEGDPRKIPWPPWLDAGHPLAAGGHVIPLVDADDAVEAPSASEESGRSGLASTSGSRASGLHGARLLMVPDDEDVMADQAALKAQNPGRIVAIRLRASPAAAQRVLELARQGAEVVHLVFDSHGRETAPSVSGAGHPLAGRVPPDGTRSVPNTLRHARDVLREVHTTLAKAGVRDEITLIASGGIALPEHLAKAIICGADLVAIDIPLILALECRLCNECQKEDPCPIALEGIGRDLAVQRIVNLMGAWHSQLLEVLGAMGIREVRRLRGETGRCMFFEDLERETFGKLFGKRKASV
jgi:Pyruvate/2-oxoacid:ferredoxin oxidoreductase delta subunit